MTEDINEGNVDDGSELAENLIGKKSSEEGSEVAKEGKGVVDHSRGVFAKVQLVLDVNGQDG